MVNILINGVTYPIDNASVGDGTITIQQGSTSQTFTTNQSTDKTIEIEGGVDATEGNVGDVLTRTANGYEFAPPTGGTSGTFSLENIVDTKHLSVSGGASAKYNREDNGTIYTLPGPGVYKFIYKIMIQAYNGDALLKIGEKQYKIPADVGITAGGNTYIYSLIYNESTPVNVNIISGCGDNNSRSGQLGWMQIFQGEVYTPTMSISDLQALGNLTLVRNELDKNPEGYRQKLGVDQFQFTEDGTTYTAYYSANTESYKGTTITNLPYRSFNS